jgi:hypothetical protein
MELTLGTALIMAGLLVPSILAGITVFARVSLKRPTKTAILALGLIIFVTGIAIHVTGPAIPPPASPPLASPTKTPESQPAFTFSPKQAKWGQDVQLQMQNPGKSMDVYYNGLPLPAKISGNNDILTVTIPSTARSGYFMVRIDGTDAKTSEQLIVTPQ